MSRKGLFAVGLGVVALIAFQFRSVSILRTQVEALRMELQNNSAAATAPAIPAQPQPRGNIYPGIGGLHQRIVALEQSIDSLSKIADFLVERGITPPDETRVQQLQQRVFDPSAPDRDRLRALALLRRNQGITADLAVQALDWARISTNASTRREVLRQLDGLTNAVLKQPLLAMLDSETSGSVREEVVDVLSAFANDPGVEEKLWQLALHDPDGDVREEAQDALREGRPSPERIQRLEQKAASQNASLDERLIALRALRQADAAPPQVIAELADLAQHSTDPVTRAKLFRAFDGLTDPRVLPPLVHALQDPNPVVRQEAADALGTFASDSRVQEWLNFLIQNDSDPRVQREAHQALEQGRRIARRGR
jgi:HEAT repeat protein